MQQSSVAEAIGFLKSTIQTAPTVGFVLGTGLGALLEEIQITATIPYNSIPHFPISTVEFHKGQLIFGTIGRVNIVVMQGRFHYYEGYSMQQITFPIRVMHSLGVKNLFLTNAAGGLNAKFKKGDLIITEDHINLLPDNPLRGLGSEWGNRFVDMSEPYNLKMRIALEKAFRNQDVQVKNGVYVSIMGPNLETKAEYRWLRSTGADMVGMSTVPEVIVANQLGMLCAAVSVITDECDPENLKPVNIPEIIQVAGEADKKLAKIFRRLLLKL